MTTIGADLTLKFSLCIMVKHCNSVVLIEVHALWYEAFSIPKHRSLEQEHGEYLPTVEVLQNHLRIHEHFKI